MKNALVLAAVFVRGTVVIAADDPMPARKAGLWEVKMTIVGLPVAGPPTTTRQCVDPATDRFVASGQTFAPGCQQGPFKKTAAGYESEYTCRTGNSTSTGKTVITGDFDSNIRSESTMINSGAGSLGQEMRATVEARYVGPCELGQELADVIVPDGATRRDATTDAPGRPSVPRGAETLHGYAEYRDGRSVIVDGQRVEMAPGGAVTGAPDLESVLLGSELKATGQRRGDGVFVATTVEAKANGIALYEAEIKAANDESETQIRNLGVFCTATPKGVEVVGKLESSGPRVERVRRIVATLLPPYLPKSVVRSYVIVANDWNAFAMDNGAIFVFTGLLDDMDDDEVAIVLGHELAHATHEHSRRGARKAWIKELAATVAAAGVARINDDAARAAVAKLFSLSASAYQNGYGRDLEDQADRVGLRYAYEGGWDVSKGPRLWTRFAQKYGEASAIRSFFFSDHSRSSARARNLEKEIAFNYRDGVPKGRSVRNP